MVIGQLAKFAFVVESQGGGYIVRWSTWLKVQSVIVVSVMVSDMGWFRMGKGSERKP